MNGYLLDTNHLGVAVRSDGPVRSRLRRARKDGKKIGTCVPALCELEVGIEQVREPDLYRKTLKRLMAEIRVWPMDLHTARLYADIYHQLRKRGAILSQVDMIIAALSRQMKLVVLTTDRDFEALPSIRTENWIEAP